MPTTRRQLLAAGAAGVASIVASPALRRLLAAPEQEIAARPALVVLFLRGGQDALNTVVPHTEGRYRDLRPNIQIPAPGEVNGALDLDGTLAFHPALVGLKALYDEGLVAPIVCAGSRHPTRSHFDAQDFMDAGAPGDRSIKEGWLSRFLQATATPGGDVPLRALAMQGRLPRSLRGRYPVLAVPDAMLGRRAGTGDEDVLGLFDPVYGMEGAQPDESATEAALVGSGRTTIETLRRLEEIIAKPALGQEASYADAGRLGQQLQRTARLLKSGQGLEIVGIDWNGWDHHIDQGGPLSTDTFWRMLATLDAGIRAFFDDLRTMRSTVTMLVMTEFGRTNAENGNRGTDHGHGGLMLAIGGKVKGGRVVGEWTTLAPGRTYQNRDLEVTTDFRSVLSDVAHNFLKLHPERNLFPGFDGPRSMGLFG